MKEVTIAYVPQNGAKWRIRSTPGWDTSRATLDDALALARELLTPPPTPDEQRDRYRAMLERVLERWELSAKGIAPSETSWEFEAELRNVLGR